MEGGFSTWLGRGRETSRNLQRDITREGKRTNDGAETDRFQRSRGDEAVGQDRAF